MDVESDKILTAAAEACAAYMPPGGVADEDRLNTLKAVAVAVLQATAGQLPEHHGGYAREHYAVWLDKRAAAIANGADWRPQWSALTTSPPVDPT